MPDEKTKQGGPDRRRVSEKKQYEVTFFLKKHPHLNRDQAKKIIKAAGSSREKADTDAEKLKR